ncbi:hypothetical protein ACFW9F_00735 [Streptomyces sp. NPDC059506]|uniref:hypothetical protein n=1 Tax=Streptomyces sp. NPDC059506 TaxID=3347751 RepID=UPI003699A7D9
MSSHYFRRVGAARPSHLMYTAGVGALIDLPNFSVLVKGLESWSHTGRAGGYRVGEPRGGPGGHPGAQPDLRRGL